jgi:hypothetical protein
MTLEPSQPTFFDGMELPLMSSRAASRAKTLALPESSAEWAKAPGLASGLKSSVWLANYDRNTSSWRTSQHCLLAQANNVADGLAEFSETWPSAGMMQSGATFQLGLWDSLMGASVFGLWPTPNTKDGRGFYRISHRSAKLRFSGKVKRQLHWLHRAILTQGREGTFLANPRFSMELMGFPTSWLDSVPAETP